MVKRIERLKSELPEKPFRNFDVLEHPEVRTPKARAACRTGPSGPDVGLSRVRNAIERGSVAYQRRSRSKRTGVVPLPATWRTPRLIGVEAWGGGGARAFDIRIRNLVGA